MILRIEQTKTIYSIQRRCYGQRLLKMSAASKNQFVACDMYITVGKQFSDAF